MAVKPVCLVAFNSIVKEMKEDSAHPIAMQMDENKKCTPVEVSRS